jgi:transcriptional regulator with XRE-family HTH domain
LRASREGAGLSRAEPARTAGVPAGTLRNWEGDRGFPGLPAALRLAEALGVPVEQLAEGVEDPAAEEEGEPTPKRGRGGKRPAIAGPVTGPAQAEGTGGADTTGLRGITAGISKRGRAGFS